MTTERILEQVGAFSLILDDNGREILSAAGVADALNHILTGGSATLAASKLSLVYTPRENNPRMVADFVMKQLPPGTQSVMASTQYGMGFLLNEAGQIVFRADGMSHAERQELAGIINQRLALRNEP